MLSAKTVHWLVVGAFALHGVGMIGAAGYLPWSMRSTKAQFIGASWLLGSGTLAVVVGVIVWLVAGAGFVAAATGLWQATGWWTATAWVGSVFTLLAIALWLGKVPFGVYVGGLLAAATMWYLVARPWPV
jgi:hypothetical protein